MQDRELYQYILGLESPWSVESVKLSLEEQRVDIIVQHPEHTSWPCSTCGCMLPTYDHADQRTWRHLDSCQFKTYLHARIPRVSCKEHGVAQVEVPWAKPNSRFTLLFERLAIDLLQECDISAAARILRISWDSAWGIMQRAVQRGLERKKNEDVHYLGVDENAIAKGHKYMTLVYNLGKRTVEFITEDRKAESLDRYYRTLNKSRLKAIRAVAMDMWAPFISVTEKHLGEDKVVIDRFHVMQHLNKGVDNVRKLENRDLEKEGDKALRGSKYLWLYSREKLPEAKEQRFEELMKRELKVGKAWAMKEAFRELWKQKGLRSGLVFLLDWWLWVKKSSLKPMKKACDTVMNHMMGILNYFKHPITNAVSEGLNSKIQTIKKMACGYRNTENFKTSVYFHCGGLELYP